MCWRGFGRSSRAARRAIGPREHCRFARIAELEIRVQHRRRIRAIFSRGKHHEIPAPRERHRRDAPFHRHRRVIAQPPAIEIHVRRRRIQQLDPIGIRAVFIRRRRAIFGDEFIDDDLRLHRARKREQCKGEDRDAGE